MIFEHWVLSASLARITPISRLKKKNWILRNDTLIESFFFFEFPSITHFEIHKNLTGFKKTSKSGQASIYSKRKKDIYGLAK